MNKDLEAIRHFAGTVSDFKNFFDQKAAETAKKDEAETNAYGTPQYQGFNDVHPTRGANASPHWEESVNLEEKKDENPFKKGNKITVTNVGGPDGKRFNGKKGIVNHTQGDYVSVKLKGFRSSDIEFHKGELDLDESVNEAKEVEVTQEMWDKEWKIRKTFGKEYEEHFAKRMEAAMSKAKNEEMAENWAFINWKQLPGKAKGMTIKESLNEAVYVPSNIEEFAKRRGALPLVKKIARWAEKNGKQIVGGTSIDNVKDMELIESSSASTKVDRLPLFEDFQG